MAKSSSTKDFQTFLNSITPDQARRIVKQVRAAQIPNMPDYIGDEHTAFALGAATIWKGLPITEESINIMSRGGNRGTNAVLGRAAFRHAESLFGKFRDIPATSWTEVGTLRENPGQPSEASYTALGKEIHARVVQAARKGNIEEVLRDLTSGNFVYGKAVGQAGDSLGATGLLAAYLHDAQAAAANILYSKLRE